MILLGDMPHIGSDLINLLLRQYLTSLMPIGAVRNKDRVVHPVIFAREIYPELHKLRGDVGARSLFRKYAHRLCLVHPETPYDPGDIDTPEDYAAFQASLRPPLPDSL
jgi:molybdenum cofactor cytidylyltransferase